MGFTQSYARPLERSNLPTNDKSSPGSAIAEPIARLDCPREAITNRLRSLSMHRLWKFTVLLSTCCATALGQADQVGRPKATVAKSSDAETANSDGGQADPPAATTGTQRLLRTLVLKNLPADYENTKQWGGTKRVWDGLHVSLDGLRIKTKRRWKDANHGTWKRYRAWLIDPDQEFDIQVENMAATPEGKAAFDVVIDTRLGAWGRLSEYVRDVQLLSISAEADARVRLRARCEMSLRLDLSKSPPDVLLEPRVVSSQLTLVDFHIFRISDLHGPLVHEFGEELHDVLQDEIANRQAKLVGRINRQLEKHEDDLRLSVSDLAASGLRQLLTALDRTTNPETSSSEIPE
jgi:hypothetical protein